MVFLDDVRLKIFHLLSEATLQGISPMGALCRGGCGEGKGRMLDSTELLTFAHYGINLSPLPRMCAVNFPLEMQYRFVVVLYQFAKKQPAKSPCF